MCRCDEEGMLQICEEKRGSKIFIYVGLCNKDETGDRRFRQRTGESVCSAVQIVFQTSVDVNSM